MSSPSPSSHGMRHRRASSQKLNPFPKLVLPSSGDPSSPTAQSRPSKQHAAPTGLALSPAERDILVFSTIIKVLLYPSYRSTDFEVHRNWLAITYSLPMSKWYWDTTSEWTLDYPPFFAYFEFLLSIPARFVDRRIVDVFNLNYDAWSVIAYQRTTVILTELVLGAALIRLARTSLDQTTQRIIAFSLFLHPGFIIVDHIHFQYNAFMFGILVWSLVMAREGKLLASGAIFAVLLNIKHIYMYLAPAYFIYLLRAYCLPPSGSLAGFRTANFISLANAVVAVFVLSFGPFVFLRIPPEYRDADGGAGGRGAQIAQIFSRLFPFTRGLNHAYWAPNAWALVTALDRVLLKAVKILRLSVDVHEAGVASTSRGLVGDTIFAVLPNVAPWHTFVITVIFQAIFLVKLWRVPTYKSFLMALTLCGWTSFTFGWHVHEKAILLVLVPLSLMAADSHAHMRTFVIASVAGIFSLFPLIFTPSESIFKVVYSAGWGAAVFTLLTKRVYEFPDSLLSNVVDRLEKLYLIGFAPLQLFVSLYGARSGTSASVSTSTSASVSSAAITVVTTVISAVRSGVTWDITAAKTIAADAAAATLSECSSPLVGDALSECLASLTDLPTATASAAEVVPTLVSASASVSEAVGGAASASGLEFLPLMLTSVYCAIGLLWAFGRLSWIYLVRTSK